MPHIALHDVDLTFRVCGHMSSSFKEYIVRGLFRPSRNPAVEVRALSRVTLSVSEGERLGVIGHNGAGKSTLLRLLAGVYAPTSGRVEVVGRICSLFDCTLGFRHQASGRENIVLRGYLQGETPRSIREKLQAIAEFTELGTHLDMPVRYYSAGMLVRLGFAISTAIDPEVLLVDEVLSAGDIQFQRKARARMQELFAQARLLVMVSHDLDAIRESCTRVVWLSGGKVMADGPADEILAAYRQSALAPDAPAAAAA